MLVIPAIDLMGGEAVRLEKGDFATKTVYARRPAEKAAEFARAGATLLHVVDLDGAKAGWPVNLDAVARHLRVPGLEVELGGGLRTLAGHREGARARRAATWSSGPPRSSGSGSSSRRAGSSRAGSAPASTPGTAR